MPGLPYFLSMGGAKFYGQFCPLAKGSEVFAERWTPLIIFELMSGSCTFNDLRRGIPRISPSLLSSRLRQLETCRLIERRRRGKRAEYHLTGAGMALQPVIEALTLWGKEHARTEVSMDELDAHRLLWQIRSRMVSPAPPDVRVVVEFRLRSPVRRLLTYWLVFDRGSVDLCLFDPGYEPDVEVACDLVTLASVWLGDVPVRRALRERALTVSGSRQFGRAIAASLERSAFAELRKRVATPAPSATVPSA